jgi:hypothetical protein
VNIPNQRAIIRGIIHVDFHTAMRRRNILQAKLHGARPARKAMNKLHFSGFLSKCWHLFFLNALYSKKRESINNRIELHT